MKKYTLLSVVCCFWQLCTYAQEKYDYPFQNPQLPTEQRVADVISRMTPEEKVLQLVDNAPAIDRLGIPQYNWWNESLHGVARAGYATVFPQSITIAASWNRGLVHEVATVISDEARAKHHEYVRRGQREIYQGLTFWSPNINIFRDPRWGRGHETYGEDPYLTGQLGKEYVIGLQGDDPNYLKLVATAKHFAVHSGPEPSRHEFDAVVSERDLRETYLPAFETLVKEAHVYSVMGAYNRFRGEAACASTELFTILRDEWGFDGYVVSDCGAIRDIYEYHKITADAASAAALALEEGCDLNCGSTYKKLTDALAEGLITEADLDRALTRLFTARFKLGMFDPADKVPYANIPYSVNNSPAHNQLSRKAAQESMVLLKNENQTLPLAKTIQSIAVIGPNANDEQSLLGNYNGFPQDPITIVKGLQQKLAPKVTVNYALGCDLADGIPAMESIPSIYLETENGKQGLFAEYFDNANCEGEPLYTQVDDNIDFTWDIETPDPRLTMGNYSVRWSGYLIAPETGTYYFSDWGKPYMDFNISEAISGGGKHTHHPKMDTKTIELQKGKKYKLTATFKDHFGNAVAKLLWAAPDNTKLQKAVAVANQSDAIVLVLGLNERLEGEEMKIEVPGFAGGDRTSLDLPPNQVELMKAMVATGKPVVLVLLNGSALSINWAAANVPAIVLAGYPGQQGGNAVADVLFGDYNPAGRLPVTYYKSVNQLPAFENYDMQGRTYRYFEDEPLYPFGYGLSYTKFSYSDLKIEGKPNKTNPFTVSVTVTNSGAVAGDEVVQLYITDEKGSTPRPIRQLEGFERIHLQKGESRRVTFTIDPKQLSMINKKGKRVIEKGWFTIAIGGEQPGFTGTLDAKTTEVITTRFKL